MIKLYLGIGSGDVKQLSFSSPIELSDYIEHIETYNFNQVWLVSGGGEYAEIMITENISSILSALHNDHWDINLKKHSELHFHGYESYEDAYLVATSMREGNPKCYV